MPCPLSYDDSAQIASWAQEDVQLMTQLGILQGVGDNRFHPQGSYTVEQCFFLPGPFAAEDHTLIQGPAPLP